MFRTPTDIFLTEMLKNVSFNWSNLIDYIWVYGTDIENDSHYISGSNINWNLITQYPNCQILDFLDYFDFHFTPKRLEIYIGDNLNVEILMYVEDRRKVVNRTLESNMLAYVGPTLKIEDSDKGQEVRAIMSLSQQINIKEDKNSKCTNYPNEIYQSYKDCDQQYVSGHMRALNISPFWATNDLNEVTNQM